MNIDIHNTYIAFLSKHTETPKGYQDTYRWVTPSGYWRFNEDIDFKIWWTKYLR